MDDIDLTVTLHDSSDDKRGPNVTRAPVLFELTKALIRGWCQESYPGTEEAWLLDGMAGYYSSEGVVDVADYRNPPINPSVLAWLKALDESERENLILGIDRLLPMGDPELRHEEFLHRNLEAGGGSISTVATSTLWYHQTNLWVHFLLRGDEGRWRPGFVKYLAGVMRGERGIEALVKAMGVSNLSELDAPYHAHLQALLRGEGVEAGPATSIATASDGTTVVTPALAANPKEPSAHLAIAMSRAARGDLNSALADMEVLVELVEDQVLKFKIQAEIERLVIAIKGRDDFLQSLVDTKRKLRFSHAGKALNVKITAYEEGILKLETKKESDLESVAAGEISLSNISTAMGRKADDFGPEWLRGYYLGLAGDPKWKRFVDKKSASGKALTRAIEKDIANWVEMGAAVLALDDLSRVPIANDADSAESLLDQVRAVLKDHGKTKVVQDAQTALREISVEALRHRFAQAGVRDLLKGKLSALDGGRVRLEYDFKSPSQLEDFTKDPEYLLKWREQRGALPPAANELGYSVRGGQLAGTGAQTFRLKVPFDAPTVTYKFVYGRSSEPGAIASLSLGICDDGKGSYIAAHNALDLEVVDLEEGFQRFEVEENEKARKVKSAKPITMKLTHDGAKQVTLSAGSKKVRAALCGPRISGDIFIFLHASSPIAIQSLTIEGAPNLAGREEQRDAWIAEQLTDMGL